MHSNVVPPQQVPAAFVPFQKGHIGCSAFLLGLKWVTQISPTNITFIGGTSGTSAIHQEPIDLLRFGQRGPQISP